MNNAFDNIASTVKEGWNRMQDDLTPSAAQDQNKANWHEYWSKRKQITSNARDRIKAIREAYNAQKQASKEKLDAELKASNNVSAVLHARNQNKALVEQAKAEQQAIKNTSAQEIRAINEQKKSDIKSMHNTVRNTEKAMGQTGAARVHAGENVADLLDDPTDINSEYMQGRQSGHEGTAKSERSNKDNTMNKNEQPQNEQSQNEQSQNEQSQNEQSQNEQSQNEQSKSEQSKSEWSVPSLSDSFYRDITAAMTHQPTGNLYDASAAGAKEQAQNSRNESANRQMEAQRSQQIANQNPYYEGGKISGYQGDTNNINKIRNQAFASSSISRLRDVVTPDVQSQIATETQQQNVANAQREKADLAQQDNTEHETDTNMLKLRSRDYNNLYNTSGELSMGKGGADQSQQTQQVQQTNNNGEQNPETQQNNGNIGTLQNIVNYLSNSPVRRTESPNGGIKGWRIINGNVTPAPEYDKGDTTGAPTYTAEMEQQLSVVAKQHPEYARKQDETTESWTNRVNDSGGRGGNRGDKGSNFNNTQGKQFQVNNAYADGTDDAEPGYALVGENGPEVVKMNGGEQVIPNDALAELLRRHLREDFDFNGKPSKFNAAMYMALNPTFKYNDKDYDMTGEGLDDSIIGAYADNIRNYAYTYKPEAKNVDPSIDPNQEHIGPMAQDIEKVNPACIKETQDGIKTVDTSRLAMMNAGAIGDLARQLNELNEKFKALGL